MAMSPLHLEPHSDLDVEPSVSCSTAQWSSRTSYNMAPDLGGRGLICEVMGKNMLRLLGVLPVTATGML